MKERWKDNIIDFGGHSTRAPAIAIFITTYLLALSSLANQSGTGHGNGNGMESSKTILHKLFDTLNKQVRRFWGAGSSRNEV
jgi:hypothetical protein